MLIAMPKYVNATGIKGFLAAIEEHKGKDDVFVLFCGGKDDSGHSWCPDCVAVTDHGFRVEAFLKKGYSNADYTEPVIEKAASKLSDDAIFISCSVGDKPFWKNQENAFRTNLQLKLTGVPTLIKWGTSKRLVEEECQNRDLVEMIFEEE